MLYPSDGEEPIMSRKLILLAVFVIFAISTSLDATEPKRLLLLGQKPDGHPPTTHEYMAGQKRIAALLKEADVKTTLVSADEPWAEGPELIKQADGVVIFLSEGAKWASADSRRLDALSQLAARGGGLVGLHWGIGTKQAEPIAAYLALVGGCHGGPDRRFKVVDTEVRPAAANHPIVRGIAPFKVHEEFYYQLKFVRPAGTVQPVDSMRPILQTTIDGGSETVAWAWERPDGGRSFGFSGLHFDDNWKHAEYQRVIAQGVLWSLKLPIPEGGIKLE